MNCFKNPAAEWGRGEAGVAHQVQGTEKGRSVQQPPAITVVGLGVTTGNLLSACSVI